MIELGVWDILKSPVVTEKSVLLKEATSEDETIGQVYFSRCSQSRKRRY